MSYRAIVDMTLSIDSFRNVGMFQQGVYYLTYQMFYYKENKKIYATPYANIPFIYSSALSKETFRNVEPSEIVDSERLFKARSFWIRYKREEIPMNEVFQFRTEIDTDKNGEYFHTIFYLETKLYFFRIKFQQEMTLRSLQKLVKRERHEFKLVSTQNFQLTGCMKGITEYIPITFKGVYFSVAHGILHTSLIGFKWREQQLVEITNDYDENGVYVEERSSMSQYEMEEFLQKYAYPPRWLEDYILGDKDDFYEHKIRKSTLEHIFDILLSPLIQNWENIKKTYETLLIEERDSITSNSKPLTKLDPKSSDLEFWAIKNWKQYVGQEETKYEGKENIPLEIEQADFKHDSDYEDDMNVGDEGNVIQRVYSAFELPKEFYLNYIELK